MQSRFTDSGSGHVIDFWNFCSRVFFTFLGELSFCTTIFSCFPEITIQAHYDVLFGEKICTICAPASDINDSKSTGMFIRSPLRGIKCSGK